MCRLLMGRRSTAGDSRDGNPCVQPHGEDSESLDIVSKRVRGADDKGRCKCAHCCTTSLEWWPNPRDCPQAGNRVQNQFSIGFSIQTQPAEPRAACENLRTAKSCFASRRGAGARLATLGTSTAAAIASGCSLGRSSPFLSV